MFFNEKARSSQRETSAARRPSSAGSSGTSQEDDVRGRKRKRVQRACDMCRLKKIRCEGGQPSRKACIHCIMNKYDCTYLQMVERDKAYVQALEMRLERMEQLVRKVCPKIDIPNDLLSMEPSSSSNLEGPLSSSLRATSPRLQSTGDALIEHHDSDSEEEQIDGREILAEYFEKVSLNSHFFGNSSGLSLIRTAMDYKDDGRQRPRSLSTKPPQKQLEFWESYTWHDRPFGPRHNFIYPNDDLIPSLVDNYFKEYNPYFPVLHRPTFEDAITSKLHLCDEGFGATLLLVCACGARLSQDPRVFEDEERKRYSAGVHWFNQVKRTMFIMREEMPRLYDVQICALSAQYASGLLNPASLVWAVLGHGLRMAQSLGAHRRMVYSVMPAVQRELLKRAFWVLVQIDKDFCYFLGRPCLIKDKDCDVDLPVECDDEYWQISDPAVFFKQPEGKPSYMSYFSEWIKLNRIQSHALHTIYSITKSKVESGHIGPEWEERTAVELESALNLWLDKLPEHLRWDPKQKDFVFLTQSAALHVAFHNLQIVVHRPFISLRRQRPTPFPSLTICASAARSALKIVDVQFRRACAEDRIKLPLLGMILVPTLILLLNIWHARRANPNVCFQKDLEHIHLALHMLMALEPMWGAAGRAGIRGSISELLLAGELPLPDPAQSPYQGAIPPLNLPSTSSQSSNGSVPSSSLGGFAANVQSGSYYPDLYAYLPTATQTAALPTFTLNDNTAHSQSSMITGLPAVANQNSWNPSALPQGSSFAVYTQQPASSNAMNNFMRTFVEMSSRNPTFASIQPTVPLSYMPSDEEPMWNGPPNFEWGDWGTYFGAGDECTQ